MSKNDNMRIKSAICRVDGVHHNQKDNDKKMS